MHPEQRLLDDGEFYIELNCNSEPSVAPGFLHRRCGYGATTPSGYECIGSFQKRVDGTWSADVNAPLDQETDSDCLVLATGVSRMDAIAALWQGRKLAVSIHH